MASRYSHEQRHEYLGMIDRIGGHWLEVFEGDADFYSAVYWDLFTGIWRAGKPVRKTDALKMMTRIKSAHTAGKYVETALARGLLVETPNEQDHRSVLLLLSPEMKERLDRFFDEAVDELRLANQRIADCVLPALSA